MSKKAPVIHSTRNYDLFVVTKENRPTQLSGAKRKKLFRSMQVYGFLPGYPIRCKRVDGQTLLTDGQHRLHFARQLGLPVYYMVCEEDIDIAEVNDTQVPWCINDYAGRWAAMGNPHYIELIEFANNHRLPISLCVAMLGNQIHERNLLEQFKDGRFKIKSRDMADRVASLLAGLCVYNKKIKGRFLIAALFAVCLIEDFSDHRLLSGAKRQPELLMQYGSRDGYMTMLEYVYNFGRSSKYPLKINAENAIRRRNPAIKEAA